MKKKIESFKFGLKDLDSFPGKNKIDEIFERIAKDIQEKKDNAIAMEFTKRISELLKKNGVVPKISEYRMENHAENHTENKIEMRYGVNIDELDFSEHNKVFEDKIADLENIINHKLGGWDKHGITYQEILDMKAENRELKQRIAELESKEMETCEKEPTSDNCRPSMEWYDNRHQSDCIEINRLNTTIDVLIHKVEYLRQFAGL